MITKEQAMTADNFIQVKGELSSEPQHLKNVSSYRLLNRINYRRNGKTKTWKSKSRINEFSIPVKRGLSDYGYITQDNAHLFEVAQ